MIILYIMAMVMILREEAERIIWSYAGNDMLSHFWVSSFGSGWAITNSLLNISFEAIERSG